jgi:hypothetical protein
VIMSRQPDLVRRRREEAARRLTRWLRYTSPAPSPRDVDEMLTWIDELKLENRGLREDLLASVERNIEAKARA